jgi:isopenicillin N synthase-like dioxygenase
MTALPVLDLARATPRDVREALQQFGAMLVRDPSVPISRCEQALADSEAFFALPQAEKDALAIARSPHFRGYSHMHNERDWREQIHFGREVVNGAGSESFVRLEGPNLWPGDAAWRERMLAYLAAVERVGQRLLALIAQSLGQPADVFVSEPAPYLLMKLIRYHAQPDAQRPRQGVAAHLDFSWVTLTLQDGTGGLEVQDPHGAWIPVAPVPGTWLVNLGELLQFATRGAFVATPHRVVNPSAQRSRISIPMFLNPGLRAMVAPLDVPDVALRAGPDKAHVHHVLDPAGPRTPFVFGEAEWRRKGENLWCRQCVTPISSAARLRE